MPHIAHANSCASFCHWKEGKKETKPDVFVQLQTELAEDEGSLRAEEAIEPVKQWWQRQQSSAPTDYFTSEDRDTPHGHVSHTEQAHQSSRPGNTTVTSSQQTSESASCGDQLQQPSRQVRLCRQCGNECLTVGE